MFKHTYSCLVLMSRVLHDLSTSAVYEHMRCARPCVARGHAYAAHAYAGHAWGRVPL